VAASSGVTVSFGPAIGLAAVGRYATMMVAPMTAACPALARFYGAGRAGSRGQEPARGAAG
jgi:hypothetical protein